MEPKKCRFQNRYLFKRTPFSASWFFTTSKGQRDKCSFPIFLISRSTRQTSESYRNPTFFGTCFEVAEVGADPKWSLEMFNTWTLHVPWTCRLHPREIDSHFVGGSEYKCKQTQVLYIQANYANSRQSPHEHSSPKHILWYKLCIDHSNCDVQSISHTLSTWKHHYVNKEWNNHSKHFAISQFSVPLSKTHGQAPLFIALCRHLNSSWLMISSLSVSSSFKTL